MLKPKKFLFLFVLVTALAAAAAGAGLAGTTAAGDDPAPVVQTTPGPIQTVPMSNDACLECHANEGMRLPLESGEEISLHVDRILYRSSIHGRLGYACVQCHTDITGFPHPERTFESERELIIQTSQVCGTCHEPQQEQYDTGYHAQLLEEGNQETAVCADCHGSHSTEQFSAGRTAIPKACQQCHADIYDIYADSVHGEVLFDEFNVDVPTCIDCHSHHSNEGPAVEGFHLFSPTVCINCHENEALMEKYDINTNVTETYFADFHGTTVRIFEQVAPDQETNKPVCIDCHGVHNIKAPDDVESTVFKQNILSTCQRCHPGATPNFPASWLSHYEPDAENHTVVYVVDLFYTYFIPITLGVMGVFVVTDFWRTRIYKPRPETRQDDEE